MKSITKILGSSLITFSYALTAGAFAESKLVDDSPHFGKTGWEVSFGAGLFSASDSFNLYQRDDDNGEGGLDVALEASYIDENFYVIGDNFFVSISTTEGVEIGGVLLGYTLIENDNWALDTILNPRFRGPGVNDLLDTLDDRDQDLQAGLRYSAYFDNSLIRVDLSRDIINTHDGLAASIAYDHEWQLKNWVLTGTVIIAYISEDIIDYYYGVDADEATARFPVYQADSGLITTLALDAEYPISENWTFKAELVHRMLDDEIANSPITNDEDNLTRISSIVSYHF